MSYMHLKFSFLEIKLLFYHPPYICAFVQCFLCWLVTSPLWPFPHFLHPVSTFCSFYFLTGSKVWFHPHPHCCCLCLELNTFPLRLLQRSPPVSSCSCSLSPLISHVVTRAIGNYPCHCALPHLSLALITHSSLAQVQTSSCGGHLPIQIHFTPFPWCFSSINIKLC